MKHQGTEGSIVTKTREQLVRDLDRLLDTDIHIIRDKERRRLDMDLSERAMMSMWEIPCAIVELKVAQAQDKVVSQEPTRK